MDDSFTLTLSGNSSVLETQYLSPIELSSNKNYVLGLVGFLTFNSIPNVDIDQNKFYVDKEEIIIPIGSYKIEDIHRYLENVLMKKGIGIYTVPNNNTLRSAIFCNREINFEKADSIGHLLGFKPQIHTANKVH